MKRILRLRYVYRNVYELTFVLHFVIKQIEKKVLLVKSFEQFG